MDQEERGYASSAIKIFTRNWEGLMAQPITREQLVQQLNQLNVLKEQLSNTWQQTVGKIDVLTQLIAEMDKEQQAAS